MSLSDVAGVFSRYFILGYFLPVFFALIALWQLLTGEFIPNAFDEKYDGAVAVAILAGAALPLGLVLLGLAYPILRIMEGYFLIKPYASSWTYYPLWWLSRLLLWRQRAAFDTWTRQRHQRKDSGLRILSAWRLDVYFPPERQDLLPTRFGNAVRAFELHSWKRYRLDSIGAWPRVELLLSEQERELLEDAQTGVAFFINSSVAALFTGILLAVDWAVFRSFGLEDLWWLLPFALVYLFYRGGVEAATRWGDEVRSCMDMHRLDMYEKIGLRVPATNEEEQALAREVNRFFLYGRTIDDRFRSAESTLAEAAPNEPVHARANPSREQPPRRRSGLPMLLMAVVLQAMNRRDNPQSPSKPSNPTKQRLPR